MSSSHHVHTVPVPTDTTGVVVEVAAVDVSDDSDSSLSTSNPKIGSKRSRRVNSSSSSSSSKKETIKKKAATTVEKISSLEKHEQRRIANRKASVACRLRKKIFIHELQRQVLELTQKNSQFEEENETLRNMLNTKVQAENEIRKMMWKPFQLSGSGSGSIAVPRSSVSSVDAFASTWLPISRSSNTDGYGPKLARNISPSSSIGSHMSNSTAMDYVSTSMNSSSFMSSSNNIRSTINSANVYNMLVEDALRNYIQSRP